MMETDILICVLISLEEYGSLQVQILFKNEPNLANFASNDYLKFYTMETNTEKCLLICLVFFGELGQKLVKNKPKIANFAPKS